MKIFEEINEDLGLTFRYEWNSSNKFGFVKKSALINTTSSAIEVTVLDGLQNILPYGVNSDLQSGRSNLVDAYKKSELQPEAGLGIYSLSAIIVDKAEPSEALRANVVWSHGLETPKRLLSSLQLDAFRRGEELKQEVDEFKEFRHKLRLVFAKFKVLIDAQKDFEEANFMTKIPNACISYVL